MAEDMHSGKWFHEDDIRQALSKIGQNPDVVLADCCRTRSIIVPPAGAAPNSAGSD